MIPEKEQEFVRGFLKDLSPKDLQAVAVSISKHNLTPISHDDAMNIICQHSENVTSILEKKKITKSYLSKYLHNNGISIVNAWDKPSLIRKILEFWNIQAVPNCNNDLQLNKQQYNKNFEIDCANRETVPTDYYRHLSYNFANWFYSLVNDDDLDKLGPEHFFVDTYIKLALYSSETNAVVVEANNSKDAAQILRDFKIQFAIKFLPNLTPDSIHYEYNLNGVLQLIVCGTLHLNGESRVIGFFDQLFLLFRDISDNQNWKVQKSHITLKSAQFAIEPGSRNTNSMIPDNQVVRQLYST